MAFHPSLIVINVYLYIYIYICLLIFTIFINWSLLIFIISKYPNFKNPHFSSPYFPSTSPSIKGHLTGLVHQAALGQAAQVDGRATAGPEELAAQIWAQNAPFRVRGEEWCMQKNFWTKNGYGTGGNVCVYIYTHNNVHIMYSME